MRYLPLPILLVCALLTDLAAAQPRSPITASTPFPLGAYIYGPNLWEPQKHALFLDSFHSFETLMGAPPAFIVTGVDFSFPLPDWPGSASGAAQSSRRTPQAKPMTPVISVPMLSTAAHTPPPAQQLAEFAAGKHDDVVRGIVTAWTDQGFKTLFFRLGWEMNVAGTPYYVGDDAAAQANWVKAFQHMAMVLRQTAAAHGATAAVLWNPGAASYSPIKAIEALYPGDHYVDVIAADIYADCAPYADSNNALRIHDWHTGEEVSERTRFLADPVNRTHCWDYPAANRWTDDASDGHSLSLDRLISFALERRKPFAIPETGAGNTTNGNDVADEAAFPQWLAGKLHAAEGRGLRIVFVCLWDANMGGNYGFSNTADDKPQEAAAWAQYFGARH